MNESPLDPIALALIEDGCEPEFAPAYVRFVAESLLDDEKLRAVIYRARMHETAGGCDERIMKALRRYWLGEEQ